MKTLIINIIFVLICHITFGQNNFYTKTFGNVSDPAIIFLHGGPGYNAFSFEFSTAQKLADKGFYVIVYDQRGCGRTKSETNSLYTFEEAFADLNSIYTKHNIKTATLIGHSFGGTLGILYANNYPEKVENLILVGSPLSYQMTFKHIISTCKKIYSKSSSPQLQYIEMLEEIDSTTLEYSSFCFMHAMTNGFYEVKKPSAKSKKIKANLKMSTDVKYLSHMTREPVGGFFEKEHYTSLNLSSNLISLVSNTKVFGIYGQEDGLFDAEQIKLLQSIIGSDNFTLVKKASHSVFIDQQELFIKQIIKYTSKK